MWTDIQSWIQLISAPLRDQCPGRSETAFRQPIGRVGKRRHLVRRDHGDSASVDVAENGAAQNLFCPQRRIPASPSCQVVFFGARLRRADSFP